LKTKVLAEKCEENKVSLIFASSAAVYKPQMRELRENDDLEPISVYGESKLKAEEAIKSICRSYVILRFFNVAGKYDGIMEPLNLQEHVFPALMRAVRTGKFVLNGKDYETKDGSPVRDFVYVGDVADAILSCINAVENMYGLRWILNLGTGVGCSILGLVKIFENVFKKRINVVVGPRRVGDYPMLVCDYFKAFHLIGFMPSFGVEQIVRTMAS
jgi:UDP-glucose 4-epimerase